MSATEVGRRRPSEHLRAEPRLRELELQVMRRLDGILQGDYRGLFTGPGTEPGESRLYQPGDDVRRMDWKLTARVAAPHVRDSVADRDLELWVVIDQSASLHFGTTQRIKWDLALGAVAASAFLTARGGNRIGAVTFGHGPVGVHRPRSGREGAMRLLHDLDHDARAPRPSDEVSTLGDALDHVRKLGRRRGLVCVVSDFLYDNDWVDAMRALRFRFEILAFELLDPRELDLPPVGMLVLVDPETGRRFELQTSRTEVRAAYAQAATDQRDQIARSLRRGGAERVVLRTDRDWILDIARFVTNRRFIVPAAHLSNPGTA
jgi:uncharacterized protein (DUF58 family)